MVNKTQRSTGNYLSNESILCIAYVKIMHLFVISHGLMVIKLWHYNKPETCRSVLSNLFDTADHLVNFPPAGGPQSRGGHGEHVEREPIRGVWRSLQRGPGAEPLVGGSGGRSPLKLKHFLLPNVQWKPQIRPFFLNLEMQKTIKHCWILQVDFIWLITRSKLQFMRDDGGPHGIPSRAACGARAAGWTALL